MKSTGTDLVAYTDGACSGNPGPGGWAAVLVRGRLYEERGGREEHTTNNRMEMRAAIEALRGAAPGDRVHVVTDSRYLHDGISKWIHGWRRNGWKKADGKDVLNRDLWEELDGLSRRSGVQVTWEHVRGHAGHALNERCDAIATSFARDERPELRRGDGSWIPGRGSADEPSREYPLYLSLVDGELATHATWPECEARVKGARGSRHRKVRSERELQAALAAWGGRP
jgi:ribonuclease HI